MAGFLFVAKGTGNRDAISLPRSLDSKLPSILIASRFPLFRFQRVRGPVRSP